MENNEFVEKKNGKKILIVVLMVVGVLLIVGGILFNYFSKMISDPSRYLTKTSDYITSYVSELFSKVSLLDSNSQETDIKSSNTLTFKTDNSNLELLNDYSLNFDILFSNQKKEMQFYLDLLENNQSLIDGTLYLKSNAIYLKSLDLYDKIIRLSELDDDLFTSLEDINKEVYSLEDLNHVINSFIKYYFEALKESDLNGEIVNFYKVKYSYEITESNLDKVRNKFQELISNDSKLQLILDSDNLDEFDLEINPSKIEITKNLLTNSIESIIVGDSVSKMEIVKDDSEKGKYLIKYDGETSYLKIEDDKITLSLYEDNQLDTTLELLNKDHELGLLVTNSNISIDLSLKETSNNVFSIAFNMKNMTDDEEISIDLNGTIKNNNNGFDMNLLTDIIVDNEKISLTLNNNTIYADDLLIQDDLSNFVDIDNLSENDQDLIRKRIMDIFSKAKIGDLLMGDTSL